MINRWFSAFLLAGAGAALAVSFGLKAGAAGWASQLVALMPPCMFRLLTGIPCPFCGMTRAFMHMVRGDVGAAFSSHVLGPPVFLAAGALVVLAAVGLVRGRWPIPGWAMTARFSKALALVFLVAWAVNILLWWTGAH